MSDNFVINGYTIQSQKAYDVLNKYGNITEEKLKEIDKNGDKIITEDELVELSGDFEENDGSTSGLNSDNEVIANYTKQIDAYNQEIANLEQKRENAYARLGKAKEGNLDSIISECEGYTSQIQSTRNKILQLFVAIEDYEAKLNEQQKAFENAMNAYSSVPESAPSTGSTTTSTPSESTPSTAETQAPSTNNTTNQTNATQNSTPQTQTTTQTNNSSFVNTFNNSSFKRGVLAGKGAMVANVASKYGINANLLAAIMALETGWGTSNAIKKYNNPGGMMDPKTNWMTLQHYDSLEAGIEAVARNLKNNYINKGLTTIATIGAKYCPVGAANDPNGTNSGWVPSVVSIFNSLTGLNITSTTQIA